jgi:hypothetical protein
MILGDNLYFMLAKDLVKYPLYLELQDSEFSMCVCACVCVRECVRVCVRVCVQLSLIRCIYINDISHIRLLNINDILQRY